MNLRTTLLCVFCKAMPVTFLVYCSSGSSRFDNAPTTMVSANGSDSRDDKLAKTTRFAMSGDEEVLIEKAWQMPASLKEISGLAYVDDNRFACIQDELGTIFIYNTALEKVEQEIPFGDPADYEGIAVAANAAYVVTSNGRITEVKNYRSANPAIKIYPTPLTANENVEGLCYDPKSNNLLLAVKDEDKNSSDYKGVYAFNLNNKTFSDKPVFKINVRDELFANGKKKKAKSSFNPSGISIHPQTGHLYVVDGRSPGLLVLDKASNIQSVTTLSGKAFSQPEGIAFNPQGELFISNEGAKNEGNIVKVKLQ